MSQGRLEYYEEHCGGVVELSLKRMALDALGSQTAY